MPATRSQTGDTFAGYSELEVTVCTCGVLFAVPEKLLDTRRYDGETFWCPNGHRLTFDSNRARQERQLQQARDRAARLAADRDQALADARAQKAAKTRFKNERDRDRKRVAAGVCPCCNRTFKNLERHMASQHPEFAEPEPE